MIEAARAVFGRGSVGALRGGPRNENRSCCLLLGVFCVVDQTRRLGDVASALAAALVLGDVNNMYGVERLGVGFRERHPTGQQGTCNCFGHDVPFPDIEACC